MFFREFSVLKVKPAARGWEFPLCLDECDVSPLAGRFSDAELARIDAAVGRLPFVRRTHDGRRAWELSTARGSVEVWLTSDGSVFIEGVTSLNVVFAVFAQILETCPEVVLEDRITEHLHSRHSLLSLVRRAEQKAQRLALVG